MNEDEIINKNHNQITSNITINENLDTFSIEDIDERIQILQNEITRLQNEKKQKNESIQNANAIFKS